MTKKLMVGKVAVGGGAPVSIQSMCNTKTDDVAATVAQIHALEDAGCEIIRVAVPTMEAAITVFTESRTIACALPAAASTALIGLLLLRLSCVAGSQHAPITSFFYSLVCSLHFVALRLVGGNKKTPQHAGPSTCVFCAPQTLPPLARD
mgnify:CR=1 FL=1